MKFVCPVCGYVEEFDGDQLPEDFKCPQCGVPGSRFLKQEEGQLEWAAEHVVGVAKMEGVSEDIVADLRANFEGECSEVGMYLAMARVAHREGYPEIGLYWEKAGLEEAEHATCSPGRSTGWTRIWRSWPTCWDTAASTPRASTSAPPAPSTAGFWSGCILCCEHRSAVPTHRAIS